MFCPGFLRSQTECEAALAPLLHHFLWVCTICPIFQIPQVTGTNSHGSASPLDLKGREKQGGKILHTVRKAIYRRTIEKKTLCIVPVKRRYLLFATSKIKYKESAVRNKTSIQIFVPVIVMVPSMDCSGEGLLEGNTGRYKWRDIHSNTNWPCRQYSKQGKHLAWICKCNSQWLVNVTAGTNCK